MKNNIQNILKILDEIYPNTKSPLHYTTPFQLLVATILSAQCTDKQVNKITGKLFQKFPTMQSFMQANIEDIEEAISNINYYKSKAKNIQASSKVLLETYNGIVPNTMEELLKLPGVGRKTANVILNEAFQIPGIVVDTHVKRVSNRLGLTKNQDPKKIELDLENIIPKKHWIPFSIQFILLGREYCLARSPKCDNCPLQKFCPNKKVNKKANTKTKE